jgi:hypothetical protein
MKYRGGEKDYETNVANCHNYWSTFKLDEPKKMFERRDCETLGQKWDFPGLKNKIYGKRPTKKDHPYYVPSKYGPMREYAESGVLSGGKRRTRRARRTRRR